MPSNYETIRENNIREYGEGTRHLAFLGRLYTDRTHFIFELLQNAEDAGATKILFELFDDRLEVTHDGRLFDELDVKGVCGVAEGTKAEDLTRIGKFGIGFKSVYAYTSTPEIHSGDESFRIEHYVRPYAMKPKRLGSFGTTLFVFAFNNGIDPTIACHEIGERLQNLSARTLLFLREISEIEYVLPDQTNGIYLREEVVRGPARQVTVIGQNSGKNEDENWLVFERPVSVPDSDAKVRVELAFQLEIRIDDDTEYIARTKDTPLVVYFPTEKATMLGFLMQGPYKTTPARDNIPKDDEWNTKLVGETGQLLSDVLLHIKDLGLLTVSFLETLPVRMGDFPENSMFYPIIDAVRKTLTIKDILPADDGTFIAAQNAKLASAEWLRKLLREEQLRQLFQSKTAPKWISGEITEGAKNDLWKFIRDVLKVEILTPDSFARKVDSGFFEKQTDEWLSQFYEHLADQKALWKKWDGWSRGPLSAKSFIRLQDGKHVPPFQADGSLNCYLPAGQNSDISLPVVKTALVQSEKARHFLAQLGIPELDIVEDVLSSVIPKYASDQFYQFYRNQIIRSSSFVPLEDHKRDIQRIREAYSTDSKEKMERLKNALQKAAFIRAKISGSNEVVYVRPDQAYFLDQSLEMYFHGNSTVGFVSADYEEPLLSMFKDLGVSKDFRVTIRVTKGDPDGDRYVTIKEKHGKHKRGLNGFDDGIKVDGLEHALASPSVEKSLFIWKRIAIPHFLCIRGTVESSSKKTYSASTKKDRISESFGRLLIEKSWLPDLDGNFQRPSELCLDDLPESFDRHEKLAEQLEMKKDTVTIFAEEVGIKTEDINFIKQHAEDFKRWKNSIAKPIFPIRPVVNPERRQTRFINQIADAPDKKYEERSRSVRTSKGTIGPTEWLRNQYVNEVDQMVCQICEEEMPFRKRDGKYYFEAVEAFSRDTFGQEHEAQFLALCPLCATMYKEFIKPGETAMEDLCQALKSSVEPTVPLKLVHPGGNRPIVGGVM